MRTQNQFRVLPYTQFSPCKLGLGSSLDKQARNAQKWRQERGWVLDDLTLHGLGISASSGANMKKDKLSPLLNLIAAGKVQSGTFLLVEALGQLTREELTDDVGTFDQIAQGIARHHELNR